MKEQKTDVLELRLIYESIPEEYLSDDDEPDEEETTEQVPHAAYYINGVSLLDMIREIETPFYERRGDPELIANYMHEPYWNVKRMFTDALKPDAVEDDEGIELLCCGACGMPGCWSVRCQIRAEGDYIMMTDFYTGDLTYPFSFRFTKENVCAELKKLENLT